MINVPPLFQVLNYYSQRNFRLISVLGFTAVLMCTWEAILLYASVRC